MVGPNHWPFFPWQPSLLIRMVDELRMFWEEPTWDLPYMGSEDPKENNKIQQVSCFTTQGYYLCVKLRPRRLVCQRLNCPETQPLWLITMGISHSIYVWFNWILCTMHSLLSVICPWGTLRALMIAGMECPILCGFIKSQRMYHASTDIDIGTSM